MIKDRSQAILRSKWFTPALCLGLGAMVLLAGWLGGQLVSGIWGLAVMAAFGLIVTLANGSETIRGLRGDGRDERFAQMDLRATAITGQVLILAVVISWLVEIAQGHSGNPYQWLGAIAGLTYLIAVAYLRWRG